MSVNSKIAKLIPADWDEKSKEDFRKRYIAWEREYPIKHARFVRERYGNPPSFNKHNPQPAISQLNIGKNGGYAAEPYNYGRRQSIRDVVHHDDDYKHWDKLSNVPAFFDLFNGESNNYTSDISNVPLVRSKQSLNKAVKNYRRSRTGNPVADGLVGIEPNPGPKSKLLKKVIKKQKQKVKKVIKQMKKKVPLKTAPRKAKAMALSSSSATPQGFVPSTLPYYHIKTHWTPGKITSTSEQWRGLQRISTLITPATMAAGDVIWSADLSAGLFSGTQAFSLFNRYENWQVHKLGIMIKPTLSTTTAGSYYIIGDPDPEDASNYLPGNSFDLNSIANQQGVVEVTAFAERPVKYVPRDAKLNHLWTHSVVNYLDYINDPRLLSAGIMSIVAGVGLPTNTSIGDIYLDFDITWRNRVEAEPSGIVVQDRVVTNSGTNKLGLISTWLTGSTNDINTLRKKTPAAGTILPGSTLEQRLDSDSRMGNHSNFGNIEVPSGEYYVDLVLVHSSSGSSDMGNLSVEARTSTDSHWYAQVKTNFINGSNSQTNMCSIKSSRPATRAATSTSSLAYGETLLPAKWNGPSLISYENYSTNNYSYTTRFTGIIRVFSKVTNGAVDPKSFVPLRFMVGPVTGTSDLSVEAYGFVFRDLNVGIGGTFVNLPFNPILPTLISGKDEVKDEGEPDSPEYTKVSPSLQMSLLAKAQQYYKK